MAFLRIWGARAGFGVMAVLGLATMAGCGGGSSTGGGGGGGGGGVTAVAVTPKHAELVATSQSQQFSATVTGDSQNRVAWSVDGMDGGSGTVGTISATGLYTPPAAGGNHTVTATSTVDNTKSASSAVAITDLAGIFTYHYNPARDGTNTREHALTPANVATASFGKLFSCAVDGNVYAQPLWVPNLTIGGAARNVLFVATEHDSLYAFDADMSSCQQLWKKSMIDAAHGGSGTETTVDGANDVGFGDEDIQPEIGITGTPVIDPATNTLYLVSKSEGPHLTFHQRLHAIDILTGNEKFSGPVNISASVAGNGDGSSGGNVAFDLQTENERCALALANGIVYIAWAAHEDRGPYHGWLIGYNAANVSQQKGVYNTTPNGGLGGIWMSGSGPAVDAAGNLFMSTGNGTFDGDSGSNNDFADSILKITSSGSTLSLNDWFTPFNQATLNAGDVDVAAAGLVLLPDQASPAHLLLAGGKEGRLYLLDRDSMGHFCGVCIDPTGDTNARQTLFGANSLWGTPVFWQNTLYVGGANDNLHQFAFNTSTERFNTNPISSPQSFGFPGPNPAVSSNGASNGILWAVDATAYGVPAPTLGPAVLHAYDATNIATEFWNSTQASGNRDRAGNAVKFAVPTVANGKVYIGTRSEIDVYGLL